MLLDNEDVVERKLSTMKASRLTHILMMVAVLVLGLYLYIVFDPHSHVSVIPPDDCFRKCRLHNCSLDTPHASAVCSDLLTCIQVNPETTKRPLSASNKISSV